jgi:folate-binding protein YgfZ
LTIVRDEDVVGPTFHVTGPAATRAAVEGAFSDLVPVASGDWQTLRLLAGRPRWGVELDERTLPLELGVVPELSLTKGCYLGQEVVARLHHQKRVKRRLVRLILEGADTPEDGRLLAEEAAVGTLTATARDEDGRVVGLGFVATASAEPGTSLIVRHAGGDILATVAPMTEEDA